MMFTLKNELLFHAEAIDSVLKSDKLVSFIVAASTTIIDALKTNKKLLVCGNGGSAADAQHMVAELVGTFCDRTRKPLPALALTTNTSNITAIANDFSFDHVFSRQVDALGCPGDVLVCISTSGDSTNVLYALEHARVSGLKTIALLGKHGGLINNRGLADHAYVVPLQGTSLVQECHLVIEHMICLLIDQEMS